MIARPLIFYWRKPKTKMFIYVPYLDRTEEIVFMRGLQIYRRWFIGIYTLGEFRED